MMRFKNSSYVILDEKAKKAAVTPTLVNPIAQNTQSITLVNATNLHCNVIAGCGHALQHLIVAATGAAHQHHAGRDEDVLHLLRILL